MRTQVMVRILAAAFAVALSGPNHVVRAQSTPDAATVQHIIVKLRGADGSAQSARAQAISTAGADAIAGLATRNRLDLKRSRAIMSGLHVMHVEPQNAGEPLQTTLARLRADPAVEYAEPDQRRQVRAAPNDPLYAASSSATGQWYLQTSTATPSAVDAIDAWATTTGSTGLVIADVDTGARYDHPDLLRAQAGGRLLPGYTFISDAQSANDGDTWDADASDPGDWITQADTQTSTFSGCSVGNSSWHGTRVAGILGALTNNGVGVAGLTWSGWILPVRALGKCGGIDSDIETAMLWAAGFDVSDTAHAVPLNPYPAKIINLSLGGSDSCPQSYQDLISKLANAGVLVVASAGNDGGPVGTPANCPGVVAVAGLRHAGTKVGYSNVGSQVALSAPAGNCVNSSGACIYSLDTTVNLGTTTPGTNSYTDETNYNLGTSFSAPIVSGIAGLMLSVNGNLTPAQLTSRLTSAATAFPVSSDTTVPTCHVPQNSNDVQASECNCTTSTCGAGMANALAAVTAALRPIAAIKVPATLTAGQNVALDASGSAAACDHAIGAYAWSVKSGSGSIVGATNGSGATVVAPSSGSFVVQVVVTDDAGKTDTATVTISPSAATTSAPANAGSTACLTSITPAGTVSVTVSPSAASVQAGIGTQAFTAAVAGSANTVVTWQVNGIAGGNTTIGTTSNAGLYTAPSSVPSPATVTVTAVAVADATKSGSASVTITAPVAVSVSPTSATVKTGTGTQQFTATVSNSSNSAVAWDVNGVAGGNATVGAISTTGLYTAPATVPSPAIVTVSAVAAADPSRSGSAQVTVTSASSSSVTSTGGGSGGGGSMDGASLIGLAAAALLARRRRSGCNS